MQIHKYIYSFGYDSFENDLCKLETKYLFNSQEKNKLLFSNIKISPSISAFIRSRMDIITSSPSYDNLISGIKKLNLKSEGFKVEYLVLKGDDTSYNQRLKKLRDIGFSIEGFSDYYTPKKTFGIGYYSGIWYFGELLKNSLTWHIHKQKPFAFSTSINTTIAKSLVNIASNGCQYNPLLDTCCGVGTIMLEACYAGNNIEGCDINEKAFLATKKNISHFNYNANVYHTDVKNITKSYFSSIIDLPYNLFTNTTDVDVLNIIQSSAKISKRLVIVSTDDIEHMIVGSGFKIIDYCSIGKMGKTKFTRKIWVCENK